ncbi:MAG: ABC transporter permease [Elusimicrobiota bacterium]|nr:ABC transporter permease [Elusimicrobiota bacterium]
MKIFKSLIIPMIILAFWALASQKALFNRILVPAPEDVFLYLFESLKDGSLFVNILVSLRRVFIGFSIAVIICIPCAVFYARFSIIKDLFYAIVEFVRHIPPLAVLSILILMFGIGELSKISLIILSSSFPIFINTAEGISNVDKKLIEVGKSFKFSRFAVLRRILLPCAFPSIFSGMQLAMGYSFRSLVGAEIIAAISGLGFLIRNAETFMRTDIIFASIIVLGFLGLTIDCFFNFLSEILFKGRKGAEAKK